MRAMFWVLIMPISIAVLTVIFAQGHHPAPVAHPAPYSCVNVQKTIAVLGDGGSIAPLCGQEVTP